MPELPEIETLKRSLETQVLGERITAVLVRQKKLRYSVQEKKLRTQTCGRQITAIARRAKYLLLLLDNDVYLVIHLGMSGRFLVVPKGAQWQKHDHVIFTLSGEKVLCFRDPRRFGLIEVIVKEQMERHKFFHHLGPEPLENFDGDYLFTQSRRVKKPIKNFVMDARNVVGVGNIYATEALYRAGIRPSRQAGRLTHGDCCRLTQSIRHVLHQAIDSGGTTLNDFQNSRGEIGLFQNHLQVYQRHREPCYHCQVPIKRLILAGRSSFYCPHCQK